MAQNAWVGKRPGGEGPGWTQGGSEHAYLAAN